MDRNLLFNLKGITPEEFAFVQQIMSEMTEQQAQQFMFFYSGKRRSPDEILLFTLLGLIVAAGVQRFLIGQIGMGVLYFFTLGLCFIGTIVDALNYKTLTAEYNKKIALEYAQLVKL